jgi:hypothetical protein
MVFLQNHERGGKRLGNEARFPRIIDDASGGVLTIGKERRERRGKETGCGGAGYITVFGKKTEGTAAVKGQKNLV